MFINPDYEGLCATFRYHGFSGKPSPTISSLWPVAHAELCGSAPLGFTTPRPYHQVSTTLRPKTSTPKRPRPVTLSVLAATTTFGKLTHPPTGKFQDFSGPRLRWWRLKPLFIPPRPPLPRTYPQPPSGRPPLFAAHLATAPWPSKTSRSITRPQELVETRMNGSPIADNRRAISLRRDVSEAWKDPCAIISKPLTC